MKAYYRLLKADFMKMRHSVFYKLHIAVPTTLVTFILLYYGMNSYSSQGKIQAFVEAIAVSFPFIGAIMVAMSMELDANAGNFKEILSCEYGKSKAYLSKLSSVLISGIVAAGITIAAFYLGFTYFLKQNSLDLSFYSEFFVILIIGQIIEYIFHSILALCYGQGITIATGIVETLIAALMLTGLGEGTWIVFPCSWSARLCDYCMIYYLKGEHFMKNMRQELRIVLVFTIIGLIMALGLVERFEGRKNKE